MKEKFVMTSLLASVFANAGTTMVGFSRGHTEISPLLQTFTERGDVSEAIIVKTAVISAIICLYALSKQNPGRWEFSIDRSARIINVLSWSAAALNAARLSGAFG